MKSVYVLGVESRDERPVAAESAGVRMLKQFPPRRDYGSLGIRDLLDAREAYHIHLSHLSNVVATAIGRYRIRKGDWFASHPPDEPKPASYENPKGPRRLDNSVIRDWSWPCVLVFVRAWLEKEDFANSPDQMVPRALFLPDGRVVPTCVVMVDFQPGPVQRPQVLSFPRSVMGGGFVVVSDVQGQDQVGSIGCLVTDGSVTYALTSQHVTGQAGRRIDSVLAGKRVPVGVADPLQIRKKPFTQVYPGLAGSNVVVNMDAGLIRVEDASVWTSQVFGLGELGLPVDLHTDTFSLDLLRQKVCAFGGASGELFGEIQALFYRYKSLGGIDYVADLLIGPRDEAPNDTLPGDSGTLWCLQDENGQSESPRNRPIAVQWGAHVFVDASSVARGYALATSLSTICRELDVDVLRGHNTGLPAYWGELGHYAIGAKACLLLDTTLVVNSPNLGQLMAANVDRVGFKDTDLSEGDFQTTGFLPLADVPDTVWKKAGAGDRRPAENPNHFADVDQKLPTNPNKGKTLLKLCEEDPSRINPEFWGEYYDRIGATEARTRGLVPFRVQQFYEAMVLALRENPPNVTRFVAAAGTMAHYVGDACQPLHSSFMHDGDPDDVDEQGRVRARGLHSAFETKMLDRHAAEVIALLNEELSNPSPRALIQGGHAAAVATVALMRRSHTLIPPKALSDLFAETRQVQDLWEAFGPKTITVIADGARTLALLWASAWADGDGDVRVPASALRGVVKNDLKTLYLDETFVPSVVLDEISDHIGMVEPV
jgi:hypothetical protein